MTKKTSLDNSVTELLDSLDDQLAKESTILLDIMQRISGSTAKKWNAGTIGFDTYHYKYDSGREGDGHILGFYPRKGKITVYLMDGTARYAELLSRLGTHTETGYCIYFKSLSDINIPILEQILERSYKNIKSQDGHINRILWKTQK